MGVGWLKASELSAAASNGFGPYGLDDRSDFVSDSFFDGRLDHIAVNGLQLGGHHQLAADDPGLVGKSLAVASSRAGRLSSFIGHYRSLLPPCLAAPDEMLSAEALATITTGKK